jgi:hypothetical protein
VAQWVSLLDDSERKALALANELVRDMLPDELTKPGVGLSAHDDRVAGGGPGCFQKVLDEVFPVDPGQKMRFHSSGGNPCVLKDGLRLCENGLRQALKIVEP